MHTPLPTLDTQFQFIKSNITVLEPQVCDSTGADVVFECTPVCSTEPAKINHMKEYCQVAWVSQGCLMVGKKQQTGKEDLTWPCMKCGFHFFPKLTVCLYCR